MFVEVDHILDVERRSFRVARRRPNRASYRQDRVRVESTREVNFDQRFTARNIVRQHEIRNERDKRLSGSATACQDVSAGVFPGEGTSSPSRLRAGADRA